MGSIEVGIVGVNKHSESGFGLVEIMVAIMLFALLLMSAAPVLVNTLKTASENASRAAASQIANEQMAKARLAQASCEAFKSFVAQATPNVSDSRGNIYSVKVDSEFTAAQDVALCVAAPRSYSYSVTVTRTSDVAGATPLVTTSTLLAVPGLN